MAGFDPTSAARIVESLDRELARRQEKRDAAQDEQWVQEVGGDEIILHARRLARNWDRVQRAPCLPASLTVEDSECLIEEMTEFAKSLFALAQSIEVEERHRQAEASGEPCRRP